MAAQIRIEVKFNHLPKCPGVMSKAVDTAFQKLGPELLARMQSATAVDTGELRGSEAQSVGSKTLTLTAGTDHAKFVEFGTRKMAAQPFMVPTVEGAAGQVGSEISAAASAAFGSL